MLNLPTKTKEGKPYISYSQFAKWKEEKSFNLGIEGKYEYIASYFLGKQFADKGWAQFGKEVEAYICNREFHFNFNDAEKQVLESIQPLGVFQQEIEVDFGDFVLYGFIDDCAPDYSKIVDIKTGSNSSRQKYYQNNYYQMDAYALWVRQKKGFIPEAEVLIVERLGNCMLEGGRFALTVGTNIWTVKREITNERLDKLEGEIRAVALEIEKHYNTFLKIIQ